MSYSQAISKAAYYQKEAFYWAAHEQIINGEKLYDASIKKYAKAAEAWYKIAAILRVKGNCSISEEKGLPYVEMSYSYPGETG